MPDARAIISGDPNTYWTNDLSRPMYQLVCSLFNTCGICYQYHLKIARYWPIPIHAHCRCRMVVVKVGQQAPHPFCDYRSLVKSLAPDQQAAVMGRSLFRLWTKGVITWEEAVQPGRIRSLAEVTARQRLSLKTLLKAGIPKHIAEQAWQSVHTAEHRAVEAHRRELLSKLHTAGVNHDLVVKHVGEKLASRVNIAAGPSHTTKAGVILPGIQAQTLVNPADLRKRHADELAALLGGAAGVAGVIAAMKRKRKKKAEEDESGDEPWKPLKPAE